MCIAYSRVSQSGVREPLVVREGIAGGRELVHGMPKRVYH